MSESAWDVVIIGAGPAGLTAAHRLVKAPGQRVLILEASDTYVGGISRTETYQGFSFDIGGHRFFSKSAQVEEFWKEILPNDLLERPRSSRILYGGKYYNYPLDGFQALRNLGLAQSIACVLSYVWARMTPIANPRSFHDWVRNQFGERLFRIFFKTYTEKVWGIGCDELSADWAAQRIKGLNLARAIIEALRKPLRRRSSPGAAKGAVIKTLIESFRYPRKGPGMMWEAVRDRVLEAGAQLRMGQTVTGLALDRASGLWSLTARDGQGAQTTVVARHVISSAPLRDVVCSVQPEPASAARARNLGYRDFLTVALILKDTPTLFTDNWIYIHDPSVKVGRIQNYRSWSEEMVPGDGRTCVGLEYFCFEGDGLWTSSDAQLIALATRELDALGVVPASQVLDGHVVRQPKAYPVYDDSYRDIVSQIRAEFEASYPNIQFVGRYGMHKYNNQDHAMMTGMLAAENILAGENRFDLWGVNEDAEYLEAGAAGEESSVSGLRAVPQRQSH